jgi:hypothetical protein
VVAGKSSPISTLDPASSGRLTHYSKISGPSLFGPGFPIEEAKRSKSSRMLSPEERWTGNWDPSTLSEYRPERWLRKNANGELEFDASAGPNQAFGAGLRGCFGKELILVA